MKTSPSGVPIAGARPGDKRQARRTKVFLRAEVAADAAAGVRRAHVLDISADGARVHARSTTDAGQMLALVVDGRPELASVVWVDHPTFGVRFATPLSSERLERIVAPD